MKLYIIRFIDSYSDHWSYLYQFDDVTGGYVRGSNEKMALKCSRLGAIEIIARLRRIGKSAEEIFVGGADNG